MQVTHALVQKDLSKRAVLKVQYKGSLCTEGLQRWDPEPLS